MIRQPFILDRRQSTTRGLVGLWGPASLGGLLLKDTSGRGNDGTLTNGPTWVADPERGWVLNYVAASTQYISLGDSSLWDFGNGSFAISVWVKRDRSGTQEVMVSKDNSGGNLRQFAFVFRPDDSVRVQYWKAGDAAVYLESSSTIADTNWHHLLAARNGSSFDIYIDGVLDNSGTTLGTHGAMQATSTELRIANRPYTGFTNEFDGQLSDVRIYDRAPSAAEVQHIFVKTKPNPYSDIVMRPSRIYKAPTVVGFTSQKAFIIGGGVLGI